MCYTIVITAVRMYVFVINYNSIATIITTITVFYKLYFVLFLKITDNLRMKLLPA